MSNVKYVITIDTPEDAMNVAESIHNQLVGNQDYIDNNIILEVSQDRGRMVLAIFDECKEIPTITLF